VVVVVAAVGLKVRFKEQQNKTRERLTWPYIYCCLRRNRGNKFAIRSPSAPETDVAAFIIYETRVVLCSLVLPRLSWRAGGRARCSDFLYLLLQSTSFLMESSRQLFLAVCTCNLHSFRRQLRALMTRRRHQ
jgi:hypothetical protein